MGNYLRLLVPENRAPFTYSPTSEDEDVESRERIRVFETRPRSRYTGIRSKEMIFNLSSLVSNDIVLRVKRAGLNGSEKSESSRAWIRNQFFPASRPYDVIVWTMYPCHHDQDARYYRILICNPSLNTSLFLVSRKFREGRKFWRAGIRQALVSQFPSRFSKVKSWICPIHEASVLFASASKTPDKYRALG